MIEVELPDGSIAEFPEGTPQEVMQSAIRSHLSPQPAAPQPSEQDRARARMGFRRSKEEAIAQSEAIPDAPLPSAQTVLDLLGSGGLGAAGMMAGAPAGPAGSIALGGAGAAAGKRIARDLGALFGLEGSESYPTAGESALDAASGAAGPAASAVARPIARAVTGVSRKGADELKALMEGARTSTAQAENFGARAARMAEEAQAIKAKGRLQTKAKAKAAERAEEMAGIADDAARSADSAVKAQTDRILKTIEDTGKLPTQAGTFAGAVQLIAHGDPVMAAAYLGGGKLLSKARMEAAERLLNNEKVVGWMAEKVKGGITSKQLMGSLTALAAVKGMSPEVKRDIRTLQARETEGMREDRDALERMMRLD